MTLTIKQKQANYKHLLTLDCPDLLAALIAERSVYPITKENILAECICQLEWWDKTLETESFWEHIYDEVVDMGKGLESPADKCFTGAPEDVVDYKSEPLVLTPSISTRFTLEPPQDKKPFSAWWKVKLFFGKLFYKV